MILGKREQYILKLFYPKCMQYSCFIAFHILRLSMSYGFKFSSHGDNNLLFSFISTLKMASCNVCGCVVTGDTEFVVLTTYGAASAGRVSAVVAPWFLCLCLQNNGALYL